MVGWKNGEVNVNRRQLFASTAKAALAASFGGLWTADQASAETSGSGAAASGKGVMHGTAAAGKPNIVFMLMDNLGYGEPGVYGGGILRGAPTPRIDALAEQGTRLLNFNVEAQGTPSRSSLLTGRHAIRSGTGAVALTAQDGMTRWEVTIAQALSDAGYATGMWGKWRLGGDPEQRSLHHQNAQDGQIHQQHGIAHSAG